MSPSIAVLGAGPGLGSALARRYAREGWRVALVARRREPLDRLAAELGPQAHVVPADLSDVDAVATLAERVRAAIGEPDALYWGPTPPDAFVPVRDLTPERVRDLLPIGVATLVGLVREFLPGMTARGDGAILAAMGAAALRGAPPISGALVLAAARNYLQALHIELDGTGVYVGGLYIGAAIQQTPFHEHWQAAKAAGEPAGDMAEVDPAHLADLLRAMHAAKGPAEATFPDGLLGTVRP